jgi:Bacterial Ig-like domain (group 3)
MKRTVFALCITAIFCLLTTGIIQAQTTCPAAQMITPTNGSTLPAGAVTFQWCNASADYFLTIESVPGAHDIFFAFAGGVGPGAGVVSVTLGPACAPVAPIGCIPAKGETIFVTLDTVRAKTIISSFQYTYTAASSSVVIPAVTSTAVASQTVTFSNSIQTVTLAATVGGSNVNEGTVTFQIMDSATNIGSAVTSATLTNGTASVIYPLPAGIAAKTYTIQATYTGSPNFQPSSGTGTLTVSANPSLTMTFHMPPDGGSAISSGAGALAVLYGEMSWSTTSNPVAIANFGYNNGALVTEAGVPAATALNSARLFVDYSPDRNSGFALVNPGSSPITLQAELKDSKGATVASTSVPLGARSHTAMFVNQLLASLPSPFLGTVTLTSGQPFAAVNLSTATSGRNEMLFSALPVADLSNPPAGSRLILPQIVDGGGNPTQILLMNPSSTAQSIGKVELFDDSGAPLALDFGAPTGPQNALDFVLSPDGMVKFATTGNGVLRVGYAVVTVSSGSLPVGNGVFQFNQAAGLVSQAGVPNSPQTTSARMYVEVASAPLNRNTGIAMVNRNATASTLNLALDGLDGSTRTSTLTLGPNEHAAKFITELFTGLPADFRGVLNIASSQPDSFLTLRLTINERGETIYSTLPVADLNNPPTGIQILPQIVNGGGYKTQTIVLSTSTGPGDVFINFFDETGQSVPLAGLQ